MPFFYAQCFQCCWLSSAGWSHSAATLVTVEVFQYFASWARLILRLNNSRSFLMLKRIFIFHWFFIHCCLILGLTGLEKLECMTYRSLSMPYQGLSGLAIAKHSHLLESCRDIAVAALVSQALRAAFPALLRAAAYGGRALHEWQKSVETHWNLNALPLRC